MTPPTVRIACVHALEESVRPARNAFAELWPEAHAFDLLETSLATDLAHCGALDAAMIDRFQALATYAAKTTGVGGQTAGILFTCSSFGPAIDVVKARSQIPVLRPNEAAFEAALQYGDRLGLVVSFGPSGPALEFELRTLASAHDRTVEIETVLAEGALASLQRGDGSDHDRIVARAAAGLEVDAVILGQFSLARARDAVMETCGQPVFTTPHSAVERLRRMVEQGDHP